MPSIGLIAAGDVVYNGIHPYLDESSAQTRLQWIDALDKLGSLNARAVVAGHKIPDNDDDPKAIAQTRNTSVISSVSMRRPTLRASCSTR